MHKQGQSEAQVVKEPHLLWADPLISHYDVNSGSAWGEFLSERKRVFSLITILVMVTFCTVGIGIYLLYSTAISEERERLTETAQSQARLIEAIARFNALHSRDFEGGWEAATFSQIIDAHGRYEGFGETGEFTLARLEGDLIVFLLSHRHSGLEKPTPVLFDSELAEPMRRALTGRSGTVIGLDYRGEAVLAAHEPVGELDLGIVAKIDLDEVRSPFVRAATASGGVALVAIVMGAWLFIRITNPMLRHLQERTAEAERSNLQLGREIRVRKQAEVLLRKERDRARNYLDIAGTIIVVIDADQKVSLINRKGCEILGFEEDQIVGRNWFTNFIPERQRADVTKAFRELMTGDLSGVESSQYEVLTKTGEERQISWHNSVLRDAQGEVVATLSSGEDVTERNWAEEQLEWELKVNLALARLASALVGPARPIGKIALTVLDQAKKLTGSEQGYVSSIDPETKDNVVHTHSTMMESCEVEEERKTLVFPPGRDGRYPGLWGHALNTRIAFYIDDPKAHEASVGIPSGHIALDAFLTVPVSAGNDLLGQIALANPQKAYGDRELEAIQRIGELYALALQRHRVNQDLLKYQQQLEHLVEERTLHLEAEIAERKQAEKALRDLSGRLITAQEEERSRIARELHDDLNQKMALLAIELEELGRKPPLVSVQGRVERRTSTIQLRKKTQALSNYAREISSDLHNLSRHLHPSQLKHVGLAPAIRRLCIEFAQRRDLKIGFRAGKIPRTVSAEIALCLYRVAQEALHNIAVHSDAQEADVQLDKGPEGLYLRIKDSGVGFDPEESSTKGGLGLVSMRERLRLVGGEITILSRPSFGTQIEARVPVSPPIS